MKEREYTGSVPQGGLSEERSEHGRSPSAGRSAADDRAREAGQQLERTARETGERVKEHASELAHDAREHARQLAREARQGGEELVGRTKSVLAHHLESFARALGRAAESLDEDHEAASARYAREGSHTLDRWASQIRDRSTDDLIADIGSLSRRQPAVAMGGAAVLGVLASRFLKSSAERTERRRYEEEHGTTGSAYERETATTGATPGTGGGWAGEGPLGGMHGPSEKSEEV